VQRDAGHIPVDRVVDKKTIIGKQWMAEEEERYKGLLTPPPHTKKIYINLMI
jgi:hypothetical protein